MFYFLHFNEKTQKFYLIPAGVAISKHIHGKCVNNIALNGNQDFLQGFVHGIRSKLPLDYESVKSAFEKDTEYADVLNDL